MNTWDSDNPTPVTPLGDLVLGFFGWIVILLVGLTMVTIIGKELGAAFCAERVSTLSAQMDALEADLSHLDRFRGFRITHVSHQPTAGVQTIILVGPDSVLLEVEAVR